MLTFLAFLIGYAKLFAMLFCAVIALIIVFVVLDFVLSNTLGKIIGKEIVHGGLILIAQILTALLGFYALYTFIMFLITGHAVFLLLTL